jgi:peptidoglycan/LPS O-acetylase OafA/YrhL
MPRNNAYDLLRLIFALFVFVSHGYFLAGRQGEFIAVLSKGQTTLSDIGVVGFFTLSGYLISASFDRSENISRFLLSRVLRIFPGYWACLLVTGFVIAPLIYLSANHSLSNFAFWGDNSSFSFFYRNFSLGINQWSIKGVLEASVYKESINGSLWSLYPELQCYILVLVIGLFGLINKNKPAFLLMLAFVYLIYVINLYSGSNKIGPTFLVLSNAFKLYVAFLCGAAMYIFRDVLVINLKGQLFVLLATLALLRFGGFTIAEPLAIALLGIKLFSEFTVKLKYDISYGLYIYAYPIQQLIFTAYGKTLGFVPCLIIALVVSCLAGFLSYVLIEKPALRLKKAPQHL